MNELLEKALGVGTKRPAPGARMVNGDALSILPSFPTASVDLIACDPPYHLSNDGATNSGGKRVSVNKGTWDESKGLLDDHAFHRRWIRVCQRVLRPEGTMWVFGTQHCLFSIGWAMQTSGWRILNTVAWEKPAPPPNLGCRCLTHSWEGIIWASPNHDEPQRHVFNYDDARAGNEGKQLKDVWRFMPPGVDEKALGRHPAQKPIELMKRIIDLTTTRDAIVLDPFAGSGTTGVAALALDRKFIGVEQDPEHFRLAMARLAAVGGAR